MRTSKHKAFLLISLLLLCCYVQECQQLALITMMANSLQTSMMAAASSVLATTSSIGLNMIQSMLQNFVSTVHLGFSTLHTMAISLVSGFILGNMALAGFIFFLLAVVPAEERRSIGGSSIFRPMLDFHPRTNFNVSSYPTDYRGIPLLNYNATSSSTNSSSLILRRNKRALVNNATTGEKFTLPDHLVQELNNSTERIPKFLNRIVQNDPLNCLPLIMCGLSASRKPSERTEVLNDYAYLLREFLRPEDESPEDQESAELAEEDDLSEERKRKKNKQDRLRSPLKMLNQLVQGQMTDKKKDEVDKIIDKMKRDEEDQLEEEVLTELSEDPSDLKFALEDMKVRGLKKTISKMPAKSKTKYLSKLLGNESEEDDLEVDDGHDPDIPKALLGRFEPPQKFEAEESESLERYLPRRRPGPYPMYLSPKDLTRGAFPPPPQEPPAPDYGMEEDELYKRNYNLLQKRLGEMPGGYMNRRGPQRHPGPRPPPHMYGRRRGREVRHAAAQRAVIQKKRGEAAEADNVYDKSRVAAEVGQVTKSNRQCRALFNECPVTSITRPIAQLTSEGGLGNLGGGGTGEGGGSGGPPFLNRAVNNIRRVLLGVPSGGESSKTKRVNEIKQAIQEIHPPVRAGAGSEVKVVLNIGPSAPPPVDVNRSGGIPAAGPVYNQPSPYSQQPMHHGMHSPMIPQNMQRYPQMGMHPQSMSPHMTMSHGMMSPQMGMPHHSHMGMPSHMGMMHSHEVMSPQMGMPAHMGMMNSHEMMSPQMGMPGHMGMMQSHEMMSPQMGMPSHMGMMQSQEMMSPQMGRPSLMGMSGHRTTPYMGVLHPNNMLPPPKTTPTGFSHEIKYRVSTKKPTVYTTKRPQMTTPKPLPATTKKAIVYKNPSSSPASKKATTTEPSIKFDELEEYLKTTMAPDSEEATTITPEHTTVVTLNTFSDIVMSMEQDEPSVEDDIVVPTKFPTKDEYAQNLRETFQIFDRFKEAHNEPQVVTIARATIKPKTTTRKPSNQPKESENKKPAKLKTKSSGVKGEQADIGDGDEKDGKQEDLGSILSWFKKFANRGRPSKAEKKAAHAKKKAKKKAALLKKKAAKKKGKGKGKKKDKDDSSEESSEEDHHERDHPLVAVPPPHLRKQIHWRGGTTIVKDGFYHLLFGKRVTKPIPPLSSHHPHHHTNKPTKHDLHYQSHEHPHHDIPDGDHPQHDTDDNPQHDTEDSPHQDSDDDPHHDTDDHDQHDEEQDNKDEEENLEDLPENDAELANYFHRLRTSESVEEEIPAAPPSYFDEQQEDLPVRKKRPDTSESFSDSENYSSSKQNGNRPEQKKRKKLKGPHPIPKPDPPMSYEDLATEEEEDDGLPPIPKLPPPPPPLLFKKKKKPVVDSRSIEGSYEEDGENSEDDGFSGAGPPKKHPLVFSPFSLVRNGDKIKLKSATYTRDTGVGASGGGKRSGGSKKKKGRGRNEKGKKGTSSGSSKGKDLMKRTNGYKIRLKSRPTARTKTSATSTTTVKPKRKVLKYKNG